MIIKKLFLPEAINNYYLFSKRVLGVDIGKTHVNITQILLAGKKIIIEKNISELIDATLGGSNGERAALALKKAIAQCDAYDEIKTSLSSAQVVYKELNLPFTTRGKIEKIIGFEVEPLLPFTLADAAIDFIITHVNQEEQNAHVLVAAVQKQYIAQHLQIFELAQVNPDVITIDLLAVFSLYASLPKMKELKGVVALVDLGFNSTRIACIFENQLRTIRTINKGVSTLAKTISDTLKITPAQALEQIIRFGLHETENPTYHKAILNALSELWNEVSFTLASFSQQMKDQKGPSALFLLGGGAQMNGLQKFVTATLDVACELFDGEQLAGLEQATIKTRDPISCSGMISLSAALPTRTMQDFNLLAADLSTDQQSLVNKQIIITAFLCFALLSSLTIYTFMQTNKLSGAVQKAETEAIATLKDQFKDISTKSLATAAEDAQEEVEKEEKTWFAFSNRVRQSYLKYLLELHNRIDRQSIGLNLDQINISENMITLKGHVANFDAFRVLRKTLRESDLFGPPEAKEELDFTMTIPLMNAEEE